MQPDSERSKLVRDSFRAIGADVDAFEQKAKDLESATSQLSLATFAAKQQGVTSGLKAKATDQGALDAIRSTAASIFEQTRSPGIAGFFENLFDYSRQGGLSGSTAAEEAMDMINALLVTRRRMEADGLQGSEPEQIKAINETIKNTKNFLETSAQTGA